MFAAKFALTSKFGISMLIECKKSDLHEWVFYTSQKEVEFLPALATIIDFLKTLAKPPLYDKLKTLAATGSLGSLFGIKASLPSLENLSGLHTLDTNIKIGVLNVVPKKNPRGKNYRDDFFEAQQQVNSALESMIELVEKTIVFPVIVFDGEIYEFHLENNEVKVSPTNHVQIVSFGKKRIPFLVDIVGKSYFFDFVTIIERDFQIFLDFIGNMDVKP